MTSNSLFHMILYSDARAKGTVGFFLWCGLIYPISQFHYAENEGPREHYLLSLSLNEFSIVP